MNDRAADAATPPATYPLPPPTDDPRFTYGLLNDIAEALQHNGFPRPAGTDWADLMTALHRFLYAPKETS
jgi:hypothetical protein